MMAVPKPRLRRERSEYPGFVTSHHKDSSVPKDFFARATIVDLDTQ